MSAQLERFYLHQQGQGYSLLFGRNLTDGFMNEEQNNYFY